MFSREVDGLNARKVQESSCSGALQGLTVHLIAYMHGLKIYGSLIYRSARENCIMSEVF